MKKIIVSVTALLFVAFSAFVSTPVSLKVDTKASTITWKGNKVGGSHNGDIKVDNGMINVDGKTIKGGVFEINMASIVCKDLTDADYNAKFIGHMKSEDFFNVGKHPKSKFVISKVTPKGGNNYDIAGILTIKDIAQEITFPAVITMTGGKLNAVATMKLDRTKWDIKYGSGLIGTAQDKIIYDDFELGLNLVAAK
jgi:polyisoprenoid-binding protein YceI